MFQTTTESPLVGQAELMQRMFDGDDLSQTAQYLINTSQSDPKNAEALADLSTILLLRGDQKVGLLTQLQALEIKQLFTIQRRGNFRLLIIKTPGDFMANTPVEFMIRTSDISADELYIAPNLPYPVLVDYDLVFIAISEAEANNPALKMAQSLLQQWRLPHVNNPDEIPFLARDRACELMDTVPGIYMPQNIILDREQLKDMANLQEQLSEYLIEAQFPIIARPFGSHAGQGLSKLSSYQDIDHYLHLNKDNNFFIAPFSDYRSPDGLFRKYRIVFISGLPFLCHMAISENWPVHYLNAGMTFDEEKRFEENRAMTFFYTGLAERHKDAFHYLTDTIDLDYFGIDCAETPDGQLLIFELANAMIVHDMDPIDMFPYKQPAMEKVFKAFHQMLRDKAIS
jgi:glutathione synthase/RimK-type ligase-like ATP-grasp enzyme